LRLIRLYYPAKSPPAPGYLNGSGHDIGQAARAVETGIEIITSEIGKGLDIVATGDMGIGNTTASSAICSVMTGHTPSEVTEEAPGWIMNNSSIKSL